VLNTDSTLYGGTGMGNGGRAHADATPSHDQPASVTLTLPPLATIMLTPEG
jgi:1,4-alpha-glucan branching enzyme